MAWVVGISVPYLGPLGARLTTVDWKAAAKDPPAAGRAHVRSAMVQSQQPASAAQGFSWQQASAVASSTFSQINMEAQMGALDMESVILQGALRR